MVSESYVARDVFSSIWNLGLLSALQAARPVQFPFDTQLRQFFYEQAADRDELLLNVEQFCGFSSVIMSMATEFSPGGEASAAEFTPECLTGQILLAARADKWIGIAYDDQVLVEGIILHAKRLQYVALLEGVLEARFCFSAEKMPLAKGVEKILRCACSFARDSAENGGTGRNKVTQFFQLWRDQYETTRVAANEPGFDYQCWLSEVVTPELAEAFSSQSR